MQRYVRVDATPKFYNVFKKLVKLLEKRVLFLFGSKGTPFNGIYKGDKSYTIIFNYPIIKYL